MPRHQRLFAVQRVVETESKLGYDGGVIGFGSGAAAVKAGVELQFRGDFELSVDRGEMRAHGRGRDPECRGDGLIGFAPRIGASNLRFALAQLGHGNSLS